MLKFAQEVVVIELGVLQDDDLFRLDVDILVRKKLDEVCEGVEDDVPENLLEGRIGGALAQKCWSELFVVQGIFEEQQRGSQGDANLLPISGGLSL